MNDHHPNPFSHDLDLPAWGPYTKRYNGIAHIPDLSRGLRFDLSVFPGYYRQRVTVPHSQWESGYHPWEAAPGLAYYAYRYDLEWKDALYCDAAFFPLPGAEEAARVVRCEFVNHTALPQHLALHYAAYLNFPPLRPYSDEAVIPADARLPAGAQWIDALDYTALQYATPRPSDTLVYEGWMRGEVRGHGFVNGTGIGGDFGGEAGDCVSYQVKIPAPLREGLLLARYRASQGAARFTARGLARRELEFAASEEFALLPIPLGELPAGVYPLELVSSGGAPLELDGWVVIEAAQRAEVAFSPHTWEPVPELEQGPQENSLLLHYPDAPVSYGLAWSGGQSVVRQFFSSELERTLPYYGIEHVSKVMVSDGKGHFTDVFIRPLIFEAHSRLVLYGLVCQGGVEEVTCLLAGFDPASPTLEQAYRAAKQAAATFSANPSGESYRFSQERMAATLLTNVVYPVYTRRSFIRHFTPGKRWDCLYTWDSGFISLGLQYVDLPRAIDCLNAYTTPPGDPQAAFIHHGSPVPTQIYAFQELWNNTRSPELLEYFYPRLRQYYLFLAGRLGSSTTRALRSNLLKTWDYFYNSGGWDDYPPQVYTHACGMEAVVAPAVTTAHVIRSAKILQQAAAHLRLAADVADYQADIDLFGRALQEHAWDSEVGVFSYIVHDDSGLPLHPLRHPGGQNFNLGLDGISPLFAGICTLGQEQRIIERMQSAEHMWTPIGLASVDQSAEYYRPDGYWNGAVWFAYQWFLWKALLDLGYGDLAHRMAHTALELWKNEVGETYHCFEHFIVASRRGAGWHHFGGLSTPVLAWFAAYRRPGALTCGFDTWINSLEFAPGHRALRAELFHAASGRPWLALAVLEPGEYDVFWNGQALFPTIRYPGVLEIPLSGSGALEIRERGRPG